MLIQQQENILAEHEPTLADVTNIFALTTLKRVEEVNKDMFAGMTEVKKWMPSDGTENGISLIKEKRKGKNRFSSDRKILKPIIKDVDVTWGYAEDTLKDAIKIMSILGWENPEFYCPKQAFPMIIRSGRRYDNKDNEPVIMIAPRIIQEY